MTPSSPYRQLLEQGAVVVMTPEAPVGEAADSHKPAIITILQVDGDVTTKVAGDQITDDLLRLHFRRLGDLRDRLAADTAEAARRIEQLILGGRIAVSAAGVAGGLGGPTLLDMPTEADVAVVVAALAVVVVPHLETGKNWIRGAVATLARRGLKAGAGWAAGSLTAR